MYSKKYSQCGFPLSGWGLNLSEGSIPYTTIPKHYIYLVNIVLGENTFEVNSGFETLGEMFQFLNEIFVQENTLEGYFFTTQYHELKYSNEENFETGSFTIESFNDADSEFDLDEFYPGDFD